MLIVTPVTQAATLTTNVSLTMLLQSRTGYNSSQVSFGCHWNRSTATRSADRSVPVATNTRNWKLTDLQSQITSNHHVLPIDHLQMVDFTKVSSICRVIELALMTGGCPAWDVENFNNGNGYVPFAYCSLLVLTTAHNHRISTPLTLHH